jgi:hypothetical protein
MNRASDPSHADFAHDRVRSWEIGMTPAERLEVTMGARKAGLKIRQFILVSIRTDRRRDPTDWARGLQMLEHITRQLDALAAASASEFSIETYAALVSLEREIRATARPWMLQAQDFNDDPPEDLSC